MLSKSKCGVLNGFFCSKQNGDSSTAVRDERTRFVVGFNQVVFQESFHISKILVSSRLDIFALL